MKCINFDERFERFAANWLETNSAKFKHNLDRMELAIPEVYEEWLKTPADWLEGCAPGAYFKQYHSARDLIEWMLLYHKRHVLVPDQLLERLTDPEIGAEPLLFELLEAPDVPEEVRLTTISLLSELSSIAPLALYIQWIAKYDGNPDRADMAADALISMGSVVAPAALLAYDGATHAGRIILLDVLCHFPGNPRIFELTLSMFYQEPDRRAYFASLLGKLGDDRAIPALTLAAQEPDLPYLDYIEVRNALEALGADAPEREFFGDSAFEAMRRME